MKKKNLVFGVALVSTIVCNSGCVSYFSRAPQGSVSLEALETTATYDIIGDATGTATGGKLFGLISIGGEDKFGQVGPMFSANPVMRAAVYNAIESVPTADTILAPRYRIKTSNYIIYSEQTVTVKGKAVRYNVSAK